MLYVPTRLVTAVALSVLVFGGLVSGVRAQSWAVKMFDKLEHDFGTVARGADTVYRFEITNIYKQTMHISGVRSSCGCTTWTVENKTIQTYEKAYIVAKFDTRKFVGRRGATLTVSFGAPFPAEVQLRVHGNIRSDVVFNPGAIQFGSVDQGSIAERRVAVTYAGRSRWRIEDVTNDNDHFEVELTEQQRGNGRVSYGLLVRLKENVPPGYIKDQLTVITNDPRAESRGIPLMIEGHIVPEISVTPQTLVLGELRAGEEVKKKIVIRGKTPFKIVEIGCGDNCFQFNTDDTAKQVHLVEITYRAGDTPGKLKRPVLIKTDAGIERTATCVVSATLLPSEEKLEVESSTAGESDRELNAATASR